MARRRRKTEADAIVDLIARFPWWVGVILALFAYLILHEVAQKTAIVPDQAAQQIQHVGGMGKVAQLSLIHAAALIGQYMLPFLFSLGALFSFLQRRKSRSLHTQAKTTPDAISAMSWQDFEHLMAEHFRQEGFQVQENWQGGADGGVDIALRKGKDLYLVQCKQWRARQVGVQVVRELYGVMAARHAAGGYVVTTGSFTQEAIAFAQGRELILLDGERISRIFRQAQHKTATSHKITPSATQTPPPHCPLCRAVMVQRQAKQGQYAGQMFWGCCHFPKCKGVRPAGT